MRDLLGGRIAESSTSGDCPIARDTSRRLSYVQIARKERSQKRKEHHEPRDSHSTTDFPADLVHRSHNRCDCVAVGGSVPAPGRGTGMKDQDWLDFCGQLRLHGSPSHFRIDHGTAVATACNRTNSISISAALTTRAGSLFGSLGIQSGSSGSSVSIASRCSRPG